MYNMRQEVKCVQLSFSAQLSQGLKLQLERGLMLNVGGSHDYSLYVDDVPWLRGGGAFITVKGIQYR